MKKVYCNNCQQFNKLEAWGNWCGYLINMDANKRNNCIFYKRKWWKFWT